MVTDFLSHATLRTIKPATKLKNLLPCHFRLLCEIICLYPSGNIPNLPFVWTRMCYILMGVVEQVL